MLKKVMPILALLLGLVGGATSAVLLALSDTELSAAGEHIAANDPGPDHTDQGDLEIVKLPSQFVVPVIIDNRVRAMVILTVALEVGAGNGDTVRALEPKLRDEFLAELFNLAAMDGFRDELLTRQTLELVKRALTERSREVIGSKAVNVLITDMARQDTY